MLELGAVISIRLDGTVEYYKLQICIPISQLHAFLFFYKYLKIRNHARLCWAVSDIEPQITRSNV